MMKDRLKDRRMDRRMDRLMDQLQLKDKIVSFSCLELLVEAWTACH